MTRPSGEIARTTFRENCYRCFKPVSHCLCQRIPRVANKTHVTILQHPRERFHAIGTARIARLGLERVDVIVPNRGLVPNLGLQVDTVHDVGLLFPSPGAIDLLELAPSERPSQLIVLDGTWSQARKLYDANPFLSEIPHVSLSPSEPTRYRIRKAPGAQFISTLEAIVQALEILEPETVGLRGLLDVFDGMIDDQVVFEHRVPRRRVRRQNTT